MPRTGTSSRSGLLDMLTATRLGQPRIMSLLGGSRRRPFRRGLLVGSTLGAALMFLLDPIAGRRRRALIRDKFVHVAHVAEKTATDTLPRKADYVSGFATGAYHRAKDVIAPQQEPLPDQSEFITDRVMSIVFRDPKLPKGQVNVNTVDQVVYLRGHIDDQNLVDEIVERTRNVAGVKDVVNLINRPDVDPSVIREEDWRAV